jgi:hypothetical protein
MESNDEIDGDEVNELIRLTARLEQQIANFSFTGPNVGGSIQDGGFTYNPGPDPNLEEEGE